MPNKSAILPAIAITLIVSACGSPSPDTAEPAEAADSAATADTADTIDYAADAQRIATSSIIVDTHIDVPMRLHGSGEDVSVATEGGDFDYPRALSGGLNAAFMSIYTAAELETEGRSREVADELIDIVEGMALNAPDKFAIARSPEDVRRHFEEGVMSLPMGMENGSPLEGDLAALKHFYDRGIRYITLAHGLSNHISDSSYDENRQWGGLSDFGVEVVKEMSRFGIMVDVSHLSDDAVRDVLEVSKSPVIASHSSARHFTPGWERNLSDELIVAIAEHGGVIQINFGSGFISQDARAYDTKRWAEGREYMADNPDITYEDMFREWMPNYVAENGPYPYASLDDVLDHFDHMVELVGVEHIGIGSDFDGVGDSLPDGLKDVAAYPNLVEGLLHRGYSEEDVRRILGENLLRVWEAVEAKALRKQEAG